MAIKTLKIKRVFAFTIHRGLKTLPPKEYPTTDEIKKTITDILPALKMHIQTYLDMSSKAEELAVKVSVKEMNDEEMKKGVDVINEEWKKYSKEEGSNVVEVTLEGDAFNTFRAQFERDGWGKTWVANIEEFAELMEAFSEAAK